MSELKQVEHMLSGADLFRNFPKKRIKSKDNSIRHKDSIRAVFLYCLKLIIRDIVEHNVTFILPSRSNAKLHIRPVVGEEYKRRRRANGLKKYDPMRCNFMGYEMVLEYNIGKTVRRKSAYLHKFYDINVDNIKDDISYY